MTDQETFDKIIADTIKPDSRLTPDRWNELFGILLDAEEAGLSLEKLSPMTKHNFKYWKEAI